MTRITGRIVSVSVVGVVIMWRVTSHQEYVQKDVKSGWITDKCQLEIGEYGIIVGVN